jgi:hypothetical protein
MSREKTIINVLTRADCRGKADGDDINLLQQQDINILEHLRGLVDDPTTAVAEGRVSGNMLHIAVYRWAQTHLPD